MKLQSRKIAGGIWQACDAVKCEAKASSGVLGIALKLFAGSGGGSGRGELAAAPGRAQCTVKLRGWQSFGARPTAGKFPRGRVDIISPDCEPAVAGVIAPGFAE